MITGHFIFIIINSSNNFINEAKAGIEKKV